MNRRELINVGVLSAFGAAATKLDLFAASGGVFSSNLDDWAWLALDFKGRRVSIPMAEVFAALEEQFGSSATPVKKARKR